MLKMSGFRLFAFCALFFGTYFLITNLKSSLHSFFSWPEAFAQTVGVGMYPRSTYLTNITWDTQFAKVTCGDNAAATWAANDALYGSLGDCQSSFNIVEIFGTPYGSLTKRVTNATVDGKKWDCCGYAGGKVKASGLLAVGNLLYGLGRNWDGRNGVGLIVSTDGRAEDFRFTGIKIRLGYPVFVNAGKGYADAPDNYVYVFGHGCEDSAYSACSRMHMLRVPRDRMTTVSAYEYFVRMEGATAIWAQSDPNAVDLLQKAGSVFDCGGTGLCNRSGITYNPVLRRYLVWMSDWNGTDDFRNKGKGGFGIYESATPWDKSSWKLVWHTPTKDQGWDLDGIGDAGNFTTKWMSNDGLQLYLAYGGTNSFTLRKATFTLNGVMPSLPVATPVATAVKTNSPLPSPTNTSVYPPIDYNDDSLGLIVPTPTATSAASTVTPGSSVIASPRPTTGATSVPRSGYLAGLVENQRVDSPVVVTYDAPRDLTAYVVFYVDGIRVHSEYGSPYSMGGDSQGQLFAYDFIKHGVGVHKVSVEWFRKDGGAVTEEINISVNRGLPSATPATPSPTQSSVPQPSNTSISLTGISAGQTVSGRILVEAMTSLPNVSKVSFLIDDRRINDEYIAPWHMGEFVNYKPVGFDTSRLNSGRHILTVVVVSNRKEYRINVPFTK